MAFIICLIATAYLISGNLYFGHHKKGYSPIKHTISELGETGSKYQKQVSLGLFLPTGILLAIVGLRSWQNISAMGLACSLSVGYLVAAFFPCDPGSPSSGSSKQNLHNLGGFIEYAGSIIFIMKAAENDLYLWYVPFKTIGFVVIICIILTSIPKNPIRGLAQRISELLLFACLLRQLY